MSLVWKGIEERKIKKITLIWNRSQEILSDEFHFTSFLLNICMVL